MNNATETVNHAFIQAELDYWKSRGVLKKPEDLDQCVDAVLECLQAMASDLSYSEEAFTQPLFPVCNHDKLD